MPSAATAPRLVSASADRSIRVWDVKDGRLQKTFTGRDVGRRVAFGGAGKWFVTSEWVWSLKLQDVESGKILSVRKGIGAGEGLAISGDGSAFATTNGRQVLIHRDLLRMANADEEKRIRACIRTLG